LAKASHRSWHLHFGKASVRRIRNRHVLKKIS
jgi:hypothetical protein